MSLFRFDDGSFYPFKQEQEDALDRRIARLRSFGAGLFIGGLIGVLTGWGSAALEALIREGKAEAWDEGQKAWDSEITNPYRAKENG